MEFIVSFLVKILYNILYIFTLLHQEFKKYTQKVYLSNQNIKYIVDDINEISISIYYYFANHKREKKHLERLQMLMRITLYLLSFLATE